MIKNKISNLDLYNPVGRQEGLNAQCPNCEELIPVFGHVCGYCGYKVRLVFEAEEIPESNKDLEPKEAVQHDN